MTNHIRIAMGCDLYGVDLKEKIIKQFTSDIIQFEDFGVNPKDTTAYPDIAQVVCERIQENKADRGILICGTGIGMSISANKFKGIYAAVCHDLYSTQRSILSNDANVMCLGALVIGEKSALALVEEWLKLKFLPSPSQAKIDKIKMIEMMQSGEKYD
jgi:ribose 5-phosphate isomerase B